jgi:glycosyltransferase involved in cell wall biosynthesis
MLRSLAGRLAPDRIVFHGPRYGEDLLGLIRRAGATILPSRQMEGTPYAVLQSFAWARPVIATAVGSLPDVVRHGETGLLVSPGDVTALSRALRRLVDEAGLARRLGALGRADVVERYSPDACYAQTMAAYAEAGVVAARANSRTTDRA